MVLGGTVKNEKGGSEIAWGRGILGASNIRCRPKKKLCVCGTLASGRGIDTHVHLSGDGGLRRGKPIEAPSQMEFSDGESWIFERRKGGFIAGNRQVRAYCGGALLNYAKIRFGPGRAKKGGKGRKLQS